MPTASPTASPTAEPAWATGPSLTPRLLPAERAFRAMGTDAHVFCWLADERPPAEALLDEAERLIHRYERAWSRFLPESDVSRLNRAGGAAVVVAPETFELLGLCLLAYRRTAGRFDPTLLDALEAAGYDRSFELVQAAESAGAMATAAVSADRRPWTDRPPFTSVSLEPSTLAVHLPAGMRLDLGGIGKGRAADLVVQALLDRGAAGACVNLGGDLRVAGRVDGEHGLVVGVEDPLAGPDGQSPVVDDLTVIGLNGEAGLPIDAAVATTARTRRRWRTTDGEVHHLIDPATGRPARSGLASVTVVAPSAAWADVYAKAAFVAGASRAAPVVAGFGASALLVDDDAGLTRVNGFERYEL